MAGWIQPIVIDLSHDFYAKALGNKHKAIKAISVTHGRFWQALMADDIELVAATSRELNRHFRANGVPQESVRELDENILNELMDVVTVRFSRSPGQASACGHILLQAARRLTLMQLATTTVAA